MALVAAPLAASAQSPFHAGALGFRYLDAPPPSVVEYCRSDAYGPGFLSAATGACGIPQVSPGGVGSAVASAMASLAPAAGTFKTRASLQLNGYTLSQLVPQFDATGSQLFTYAPRPDNLNAFAFGLLFDQFTLAALPGVSPASMSMSFGWSGTLQVDPMPPDVSASAGGLFHFTVAPTGVPSQTSYAVVQNTLFVDALNSGNVFFTGTQAPVGSPPLTSSFVGSTLPGSTNGVFSVGGIPLSGGGVYDFDLDFQSYVAIAHASLSSNQPPCDVAIDPACVVIPPVDVTADLDADFSHTLTFNGYRIFDANGNDITSSVQLRFASGLLPAVTATPEPATLALVGGGLLALGAVVRRRRVG